MTTIASEKKGNNLTWTCPECRKKLHRHYKTPGEKEVRCICGTAFTVTVKRKEQKNIYMEDEKCKTEQTTERQTASQQ